MDASQSSGGALFTLANGPQGTHRDSWQSCSKGTIRGNDDVYLFALIN